VFFLDEARFGLMTTISRIWAEKGKPLKVKVKQGRKNFHFAAAVSPFTGEAVMAPFPLLCVETMASFLKLIGQSFPDKIILLIMDGAGWHTSPKLVVPDNIRIVKLPPYSPDLNPIEKLWKHIRQEALHNRLFESLDELFAAVSDALSRLGVSDLMRICACHYL